LVALLSLPLQILWLGWVLNLLPLDTKVVPLRAPLQVRRLSFPLLRMIVLPKPLLLTGPHLVALLTLPLELQSLGWEPNLLPPDTKVVPLRAPLMVRRLPFPLLRMIVLPNPVLLTGLHLVALLSLPLELQSLDWEPNLLPPDTKVVQLRAPLMVRRLSFPLLRMIALPKPLLLTGPHLVALLSLPLELQSLGWVLNLRPPTGPVVPSRAPLMDHRLQLPPSPHAQRKPMLPRGLQLDALLQALKLVLLWLRWGPKVLLRDTQVAPLHAQLPVDHL
jgi:hypothetical protein